MAEYGWFDLGNGRRVFRRLIPQNGKRSKLSCPMLITDTIEPTQSMADGKFYTSKQALRGTYKASGNPQGVEYIELGNEQRPDIPKGGHSKIDDAQVKDIIARADAAVERGEGLPA